LNVQSVAGLTRLTQEAGVFAEAVRTFAKGSKWHFQLASIVLIGEAVDQTLGIMPNRPFVRTARQLPREMGPLQEWDSHEVNTQSHPRIHLS
jgi:hypothetical protein